MERKSIQYNNDEIIRSNLKLWCITKPLRKFIAFVRQNKILSLFAKGLLSIKRNGLSETIKKVMNYRPIIFPKKLLVKFIHKPHKELCFSLYEMPIVSIIIPVYNQFIYTYNCLKSILENSTNVKYEILLADDISTDNTRTIDKIVKNIQIIRNKERLRFLNNCNNASKFAKGKYLLYLNNDTVVQKGWLFHLVKLMEQDETIGLVGSKLIYPNGTLQEAGGIIWSDGSGHNYGNGFDPEKSEFNYVKDVDYISGASILVRRALWENLGGFDDLFAPAYYEDTDLAFRIREAGYRVVYQPASVVVHFEGKSNGTDTNFGQKSYQITNQKKFVEKWHSVLDREYFPKGEKMFLARGNRGKKLILVIDRYVPQYDKDAGSRCTYMYINLFLKLGLNVVFLSEEINPLQPYTFNLQQMGVEILYGKYYSDNRMTWIKENGIFFDYIFTCRSHISIKYIDYFRQYSNAKIIYYPHDLGYLRHYRQYEITNNQKDLDTAKYLEKIEREMAEKSDVIYVVGSYERQHLINLFPQKPIYNIPVYIYDKFNEYSIPLRERKSLLFVGGFDHAPNEDAVLWFYENAFSKIIAKYPDIKWYVVGSNPTKKMLAMNDKHIVITGYVTEEKLKHYYNTCRICVVPLRFGAGVKGKVIEAAYYMTPIITTNIGAEGISLEEDAFIVNPPDDTFAKAVIDLYANETRLEQLSQNCTKFINSHFSIDHAIKIVKEEIKV